MVFVPSLIEALDTNINSGKLNKEGYEYVAKEFLDIVNFEKAAITLRNSISANDND